MRDSVRPDVLSLASGAMIAALGALVLLDSTEDIDLSLGWVAVALTAAVGLIVLISGLTDNSKRDH